ncbi:MAG: glycoside hydrolase family 108 protein [Candidatus Acidiferrales bacterium]
MADFNIAVQRLLRMEGGLVKNPLDPGGPTKYGISQRTYPDLNIRNLTEVQAIAIYLRDYWKFGGLTSQLVANKVLDMAVNFGQETAGKLLQQALIHFAVAPLVPDGIVGLETVKIANAIEEGSLLSELMARGAYRHAQIACKDQTQVQFLMGWLRRDCAA